VHNTSKKGNKIIENRKIPKNSKVSRGSFRK